MQVQGALRIEEYDADDAEAVAAGWSVLAAAEETDAPFRPAPTLFRRTMEVRHGWDRSPTRYFVARADGVPVAAADLELPEWDNRDLAWSYLVVHPAHRRRGHGTELLGHLRELSRAAGRTTFGGAWWEVPGSATFALRHGLPRVSQEIYRLVHPRTLPANLVETAYAESAVLARDYELVRLLGRSSEDVLPMLAGLTSAINDAPLDDLALEDEVFTPERVRDYESATLEGGHRLYRIVARRRSTGEPAGHTAVAVDVETPTLAHQHDTAVVRSHRGHRLGLVLKADMMRWLARAEPQIESIDTFNAESNAHMIAVNRRLGYVPLGRELAFQGTL